MDATRVHGGEAPAVSELLDGLNDLLQLDHDAIGAYDVAIEKLQDRDHADQIAGFRRDHERHIRDLNALIAELGGTPRNEPHATGPFKQALQSLGGLAGDKGLLMAFRTNEMQVRNKYDMYASKANLWPDRVKRVVDQNALDEERHYTWVADLLQRMGIGAGEGPEVDAATAARERANLGTGVVNQAKERVSEVAGQVRDKVSDLAGSVAGTVSGAAGSVADTVSGAAGSVADGVTGAPRAAANRISGLFDPDEGRLGGVTTAVTGAVDRVRGGVAGAGRGAADARDTLEGRVREHPVQTLLVAGIAGFIVGRLLR